MKLTTIDIINAPTYYTDHFNGKYDIDKVLILRNCGFVSDSDTMSVAFKYIPNNTNVIDLTNNELIVLPDLVNKNSIHTLLISRNRIKNLDGSMLPRNIRKLVLSNNELNTFNSLTGLKDAPKSLENLCLRGNIVCHLDKYREYVISLCPYLKILDFEQVKPSERNQKIDLEDHKVDESNNLTISLNSRDKKMELMGHVVSKLDEVSKELLKKQLADATTLEEIERLETMLVGGIEN